MKADWQAVIDSIATSLHINSILVTSSLVFVVFFPVAIVIKRLINRTGLNLSATVSLGNQIEQSGGSPADGTALTRTGRFGIPGGSAKFTLKEESIAVRLKADAVQKAQTLLAAGKDIDSVCHEINPEYASWEAHKQRIFQRAMQAMLKAQR